MFISRKSRFTTLHYIPNTYSGGAVVTANGKSTKTYIQDFTKSMCESQASSAPKTVYDKRDENDYQVRYINGNCWMVQNLRYVGDTGSSSGTMIMKSATSNISANKNISYTDLTVIPYNDYDNAKLHNSEDSITGIYYNYAAASALTITGPSNTDIQTYDICPKNWRLPTTDEQSVTISYKTAYNPVGGGRYWNGNLAFPKDGHWWSSSLYDADERWYLYYYGENGSYTLNAQYYTRDRGYYVRCIRTS